MIEYIRRLFTYDDWANREVLGGLQALKVAPRSVKLLAHILAAESCGMNACNCRNQPIPYGPISRWSTANWRRKSCPSCGRATCNR